MFDELETQKFWQLVLTLVDKEQLTCVFGPDKIEAIVKTGSFTESQAYYLLQSFGDTYGEGYRLYVEEIRLFVESGLELTEITDVPSLAVIEAEIQRWKLLQKKRLHRDMYRQGLKPRPSQDELKEELFQQFGIRDKADFQRVLREGHNDVCERWLQHIVDNKERYWYLHADWDQWLGRRRHELAVD